MVYLHSLCVLNALLLTILIEVFMKILKRSHVINILSILLVVTFLLLMACKNEDESLQKIVIKLSVAAEISDGKLSAKFKDKDAAEIEKLNSVASTNNAFFTTVFNSNEGGLNEQGELDNYINLVFVTETSTTKLDKIIEELEQLDMVETAYQAPIGEDAGMSLPES